MKPFFRLLAAALALLLLAAGAVFHLGGKQMEFKSDTAIRNTTVAEVMDSLAHPEKWAEGVVDIETADAADSEIGSAGTVTLSQNGGSAQLQSQLLSTSDSSLTVRTWGDSFDAFSIWKLDQAGNDVRVRQLMLATHKGLTRFEALFTKPSAQERIDSELERLKSFVEAGQTAATKSGTSKSTPPTESADADLGEADDQ